MRPTGATHSHLRVSEVMQAVLTQFVKDFQESCVTNADMVTEHLLPYTGMTI